MQRGPIADNAEAILENAWKGKTALNSSPSGLIVFGQQQGRLESPTRIASDE